MIVITLLWSLIIYIKTAIATRGVTIQEPEVPQSPDAHLSWAFVVKSFISMISKVKMQEKIQKE